MGNPKNIPAPIDPAVKAYNDSLALYNKWKLFRDNLPPPEQGEPMGYRNPTPQDLQLYGGAINPYKIYFQSNGGNIVEHPVYMNPVKSFDKGGEMEGGEDLAIVDKKTGKHVADAKSGEGIFDEDAYDKMKALATNGKMDELGKFVASELKTHKTNINEFEEGGQIPSGLKPVTDPNVLKQLNAGGGGLKPVTDPELLKTLNGTSGGSQQKPPNADYSNIVNQVFNEYPALKSVAKPEDYLVQPASGKMSEILKKHDTGLEFQQKGQTDYRYGDDTMTLDNPDKNRIYLNMNKLKPEQVADAIKLDMVSHGLHGNPQYDAFVADLNKRLIAEHGAKEVAANGGADAYIRGHLSTSPEYQPYKDETKFLPEGYFNKLDSILKTDPTANANVQAETSPEKVQAPQGETPTLSSVFQKFGTPVGEVPFAIPSVDKEQLKQQVVDNVKKIHEDNGYSWDRPAEVINQVKVDADTPKGDQGTSTEDINSFLEGIKLGIRNNPNSDPITKTAAESYVSSAQMFNQGLDEIQKAAPITKIGISGGYLPKVDVGFSSFELPAALVKTGFGAASLAMPELQAFNTGTAAAEKVLPSDLIGYAMSPIQTIRSHGGMVAIPFGDKTKIFDLSGIVGKEGDQKQAAAELTDLVYQIFLFHGAKELANKALYNKPYTVEEASEAKKYLDEAFSQAKTIPKEVHDKLPPSLPDETKVKVAPLVEKKQALEAQKENVDDSFHPMIDEQVNKVKKDIDLTIKKEDIEKRRQEHLLKAEDLADASGTSIDIAKKVINNKYDAELEALTPRPLESEILKSEQDASTIESPATVDVGEPPRDGEAVVSGDAELKTPPREEAPAVTKQEPVSPSVQEKVTQAAPKELITNTKKIGTHFNDLVRELGRDETDQLLYDWQEAKLNEDGTGIKIEGAFRRNAPKGMGETIKGSKGQFINWLNSDAPFDEKVYGKDIRNDQEYVDRINKAREAAGLSINQKPLPESVQKEVVAPKKVEETVLADKKEGGDIAGVKGEFISEKDFNDLGYELPSALKERKVKEIKPLGDDRFDVKLENGKILNDVLIHKGRTEKGVDNRSLLSEKSDKTQISYGGKMQEVDSDFKNAAQKVRDHLKTGEKGYVKLPSGETYEISTSNKTAKLLETPPQAKESVEPIGEGEKKVSVTVDKGLKDETRDLPSTPTTEFLKDKKLLASDISDVNDEGNLVTQARRYGSEFGDKSRGGTWYEIPAYEGAKSSYKTGWWGTREGNMGVGGENEFKIQAELKKPYFVDWTGHGEAKVVLKVADDILGKEATAKLKKGITGANAEKAFAKIEKAISDKLQSEGYDGIVFYDKTGKIIHLKQLFKFEAPKSESKPSPIVEAKGVGDIDAQIKLMPIYRGIQTMEGGAYKEGGGFFTYDKTEAEGYSQKFENKNLKGEVVERKLKPNAKILHIITPDEKLIPEGEAEYERITGEKYMGEGLNDFDPKFDENMRKLKAAGYDAVAGNTIDAPALYVLDKKALTKSTIPIVEKKGESEQKGDKETKSEEKPLYKIGKSPRTYEIVKEEPFNPKTDTEGEKYFTIKDTKTGEEQVVEQSDLKKVKTIKEAKDNLAEAKKKAKEAYENLGIDPFETKKRQAEADRELFDAYVELATRYVSEGIKNVKEFATKLGETATDIVKNAWANATGTLPDSILKTAANIVKGSGKLGLSKEKGIEAAEKYIKSTRWYEKYGSKEQVEKLADHLADQLKDTDLSELSTEDYQKKFRDLNKSLKAITSEKDFTAAKADVVTNITNYIKQQSKGFDRLDQRYFNNVLDSIKRAKTPASLGREVAKFNRALNEFAHRELYREAKEMRKAAKKNVRMDKFAAITPEIRKFLSIDPRDVPLDRLDEYVGHLEDLSKRKTEVNARIRDIRDFNQMMQERFDKETITPESPKETKEEDPLLKQMTVTNVKEALKGKDFDYSHLSSQEIALVDRLKNLSEADLDRLSMPQLNQLSMIAEKLNNGWLSNRVKLDILDKIDQQKQLEEIQKVAPQIFRNADEQANMLSKDQLKQTVTARQFFDSIKRDGLNYIDKVLNTGRKVIYTNFVYPFEQTFTKIKLEDSRIQHDVKNIIKEFDLPLSERVIHGRKFRDINTKLSIYAKNLDWKANGGEGDLSKTLLFGKDKEGNDHLRSAKISAEDKIYLREQYEKLLKKYDNGNGELDLQKMYNDMSAGEKKAIEYVKNTFKTDIAPKLSYSETYNRGGVFIPQDEYNPRRVMDERVNAPTAEEMVNKMVEPETIGNATSSKAGSTIERNNAVRFQSFDYLGDFIDTAHDAYTDYYLSPVARKVFNGLSALEKSVSHENAGKIQGLKLAAKDALTNIINPSFEKQTTGEKAMNMGKRIVINNLLTNLPRTLAEPVSNLIGSASVLGGEQMIKGIKEYATDRKYWNDLLHEANSPILNRVGRYTAEVAPVFEKEIYMPNHTVKGLNERLGRMLDVMDKNEISEVSKHIASETLRFGDAVTILPTWTAAYMKGIEDVTGKPFSKKTNYSADVKQKAFAYADNVASQTHNVSSSFAQARQIRESRDSFAKSVAWFLRGFVMNDFNNLVHSGKDFWRGKAGGSDISRAQALQVMGGVIGKQMAYSAIMGYLGNMLYSGISQGIGAATGDDSKKRKEMEDQLEERAQAAISPEGIGRNLAMNSLQLATGKSGYLTMLAVNNIAELVNKEVTGKNYDPYKDAITYSPDIATKIAMGKKGDIAWNDMVRMMGAYGIVADRIGLTTEEASRILNEAKEGDLSPEDFEKWKLMNVAFFGLQSMFSVPYSGTVQRTIQNEQRLQQEEEKKGHSTHGRSGSRTSHR